ALYQKQDQPQLGPPAHADEAPKNLGFAKLDRTEAEKAQDADDIAAANTALHQKPGKPELGPRGAGKTPLDVGFDITQHERTAEETAQDLAEVSAANAPLYAKPAEPSPVAAPGVGEPGQPPGAAFAGPPNGTIDTPEQLVATARAVAERLP